MEARKIPPYHLIQLGELQENFHSEAAKFMHMMTTGGGLKNMHMGETLGRLNYLFMQVAAHLDAARNVGGSNISLEHGNHALAVVRHIEAEEKQQADDAG